MSQTDRGAPTLLTIFLDCHNRRTLSFRQIAQKGEHKAVFFCDRIGINPGAGGHFCIRPQGRDACALTLAVKGPAMIRAFDAVPLDFAGRQRGAAMDTDIAEAMGGAGGIAKQDKVLAQHALFFGICGQIRAGAGRIPKIDKHEQCSLL